jgi:hypothetical protein
VRPRPSARLPIRAAGSRRRRGPPGCRGSTPVHHRGRAPYAAPRRDRSPARRRRAHRARHRHARQAGIRSRPGRGWPAEHPRIHTRSPHRSHGEPRHSRGRSRTEPPGLPGRPSSCAARGATALRADDKRLRAAARKAIAEAEIVFVSAASAWEAAIKVALGRLRIPDTADRAIGRGGPDSRDPRSAPAAVWCRDPVDVSQVRRSLADYIGRISLRHAERLRYGPSGAVTFRSGG